MNDEKRIAIPSYIFQNIASDWKQFNEEECVSMTETKFARSVRRKLLKCFRVFERDEVFLPINTGDSHWYLLRLVIEDRLIEVYDSMGGTYQADLTIVQEALKRAAAQEGGDDVQEAWQVQYADAPRQTNGYDCGVFLLFFLNVLLREDKASWENAMSKCHTIHIRYKLASFLLGVGEKEGAKIRQGLNEK